MGRSLSVPSEARLELCFELREILKAIRERAAI